MAVSKKTKLEWSARASDPTHWEDVFEEVKARQADPYAYSQLPYWLGLDCWERDEGLYVLAGVEPGTVQTSLMDETWINAMPFGEQPAFVQLPDPLDLTESDFKNEAQYERYLQEQERRRAVLERCEASYQSLRHKLDHSVDPLGAEEGFNSWRPTAFLAWATAVGFRPDWLNWAESRGLLPDVVSFDRAPFFDADAGDYPELLHIAVRAWEYARSSEHGTPKQRVMNFLETRYPRLPAGSRDAIAQVVNWQRAGGRPPKKRKA